MNPTITPLDMFYFAIICLGLLGIRAKVVHKFGEKYDLWWGYLGVTLITIAGCAWGFC